MVEYSFYTDEYGGKAIPSSDFTGYINRATYYINGVIAVNIEDVEITEEVQKAINMATCNIADLMYAERNSINVTSESVGDWSRSYDNSGLSNRMRYTLSMYLRNTGLLFAGINTITSSVKGDDDDSYLI
jgi:hypothetical protein